MKVFTEIYLKNASIKKESWLTFIHSISKYNGCFHSWHLYLRCEQNIIHYYIETNHVLPTTINHLEDFIFKKLENNPFEFPKFKRSLPLFHKENDNFADIYGYYESRTGRQLSVVDLSIFPFAKDHFLSSTKLYFKKNHQWVRKTYLCNIPQTFVTIDFNTNKRFFYKKVPKYLKIEKQISLLQSNPLDTIFKIETFPYLQGDYYLNQNSYQFDKHSLILGASGSGKSKFISLFIQYMEQNPKYKRNYKIVVIDPHASLENDIGGLNQTKVIDFQENDMDLFMPTSNDFIASTELFLSLFKTLIMDQYNSKLERVLRYAVHLLLIGNQFNFQNLRRLLLEIEYRSSLLKQYERELPLSVLQFFLNDFNELKINFYGEAISPIISFIDEMQLLPVFNQEKSNHNLKDIIQDSFLTIVSLDRMQLGDKITKTISGLVMQQLLGLVQSYTYTESIIFILDEISVIENPIVCRFLSEARKYGVSMFIAGQYLNQVSNEVKDAIFANVLNYYIFRVSKLDANILVDNFDINIPLENTREYKMKLLTELPNRNCILRISNGAVLYSAMRGTTLDFVPVPRQKRNNTDFQKEEISPKKKKFTLQTNINLEDILKETSTGREDFKQWMIEKH